MYYDRQGRPLEFEAWARSFDVVDRIVGKDEVNGVRVSTVWIGIDMNWYGVGPPLIFETMVFGGPLDGQQSRWPTEAVAHAGHATWVERVSALS